MSIAGTWTGAMVTINGVVVGSARDVTFDTDAYRLGDPLRYQPIPVSGPARRYPGDGNRRERRKAAAERRRGR